MGITYNLQKAATKVAANLDGHFGQKCAKEIRIHDNAVWLHYATEKEQGAIFMRYLDKWYHQDIEEWAQAYNLINC